MLTAPWLCHHMQQGQHQEGSGGRGRQAGVPLSCGCCEEQTTHAAGAAAARSRRRHQPQSRAPTGTPQVVEIGGQKVLLVEDAGEVYALANKCSHMGLPLVVGAPARLAGLLRAALVLVLGACAQQLACTRTHGRL